jgi:hypothetical protein
MIKLDLLQRYNFYWCILHGPTSETLSSLGIKATANFFNLDINKLNPAQADPSTGFQ